jgi:hypothetical protein
VNAVVRQHQLVASSLIALSNFRLVNRELVSDSREAWKVVINQHVPGRNQTTGSPCEPATVAISNEIALQRSLLDRIRAFFKDNPGWK